mmetsp:Transcript_82850/g.138281  ORF Transcript_82850/g.138281 Transcript_82850/m.138281 type:complete len:426 (-) Transcript_82850:57-1334(-)
MDLWHYFGGGGGGLDAFVDTMAVPAASASQQQLGFESRTRPLCGRVQRRKRRLLYTLQAANEQRHPCGRVRDHHHEGAVEAQLQGELNRPGLHDGSGCRRRNGPLLRDLNHGLVQHVVNVHIRIGAQGREDAGAAEHGREAQRLQRWLERARAPLGLELGQREVHFGFGGREGRELQRLQPVDSRGQGLGPRVRWEHKQGTEVRSPLAVVEAEDGRVAQFRNALRHMHLPRFLHEARRQLRSVGCGESAGGRVLRIELGRPVPLKEHGVHQRCHHQGIGPPLHQVRDMPLCLLCHPFVDWIPRLRKRRGLSAVHLLGHLHVFRQDRGFGVHRVGHLHRHTAVLPGRQQGVAQRRHLLVTRSKGLLELCFARASGSGPGRCKRQGGRHGHRGDEHNGVLWRCLAQLCEEARAKGRNPRGRCGVNGL